MIAEEKQGAVFESGQNGDIPNFRLGNILFHVRSASFYASLDRVYYILQEFFASLALTSTSGKFHYLTPITSLFSGSNDDSEFTYDWSGVLSISIHGLTP